MMPWSLSLVVSSGHSNTDGEEDGIQLTDGLELGTSDGMELIDGLALGEFEGCGDLVGVALGKSDGSKETNGC